MRHAGGRVIGQGQQQDGAERERGRRADLRQRDPTGVGEPPGDGVSDESAEERAERGGEQVQPRDDAGLPVGEPGELQPHGGEVERGPRDGAGDPLRHDDLERGHPEHAPGVLEQLLGFRARRRGLGRLGGGGRAHRRVRGEEPHEHAQRHADDGHGVEGDPPPGDAEEGDRREQHAQGAPQDGAQVAGHLQPAEGRAAGVVVGVVGDEGADRREDQRQADPVEAPRDRHLRARCVCERASQSQFDWESARWAPRVRDKYRRAFFYFCVAKFELEYSDNRYVWYFWW